MEKLKEIIERAILVAYWRDGDVDTEDGTYATTDTDEMIRLESAIQELFGIEVEDLAKSLNASKIIDKTLKGIIDNNRGRGSMSKWVNVDDGLPEHCGCYLVTGNDIELEIVNFDPEWGWQDSYEITHWMTLPELPND